MRFEVDDEILAELRHRRESTNTVVDPMQIEVQEQFDAFLLDGGMGPMRYLTSDGRVLADDRTWDGDSVRVADEREAIRTIVVGANKTGIGSLLRLLPDTPDTARECGVCSGSRWLWQGERPVVVCPECDGLGWTD